MRAGPVDFAAARTAAKIVVVNFRQRLELIEHLRLLHLRERSIALQAAGEWCDELDQIEPANDLDDLFGRSV